MRERSRLEIQVAEHEGNSPFYVRKKGRDFEFSPDCISINVCILSLFGYLANKDKVWVDLASCECNLLYARQDSLKKKIVFFPVIITF